MYHRKARKETEFNDTYMYMAAEKNFRSELRRVSYPPPPPMNMTIYSISSQLIGSTMNIVISKRFNEII